MPSVLHYYIRLVESLGNTFFYQLEGWRPLLYTRVWEGLSTGLLSIDPTGPKTEEQINGVTVKLGSYFRHGHGNAAYGVIFTSSLGQNT